MFLYDGVNDCFQIGIGENDVCFSVSQILWFSQDGYDEINEEDIKEFGDIFDDGQGNKIFLIVC